VSMRRAERALVLDSPSCLVWGSPAAPDREGARSAPQGAHWTRRPVRSSGRPRRFGVAAAEPELARRPSRARSKSPPERGGSRRVREVLHGDPPLQGMPRPSWTARPGSSIRRALSRTTGSPLPT
jgi:hypothetical protein